MKDVFIVLGTKSGYVNGSFYKPKPFLVTFIRINNNNVEPPQEIYVYDVPYTQQNAELPPSP